MRRPTRIQPRKRPQGRRACTLRVSVGQRGPRSAPVRPHDPTSVDLWWSASVAPSLLDNPRGRGPGRERSRPGPDRGHLRAGVGVTLRSVATALCFDVRRAELDAVASIDARGPPVPARPSGHPGFLVIPACLDTDAGEAALAKPRALTERYCVVGQSVAEPPRTVAARAVDQEHTGRAPASLSYALAAPRWLPVCAPSPRQMERTWDAESLASTRFGVIGLPLPMRLLVAGSIGQRISLVQCLRLSSSPADHGPDGGRMQWRSRPRGRHRRRGHDHGPQHGVRRRRRDSGAVHLRRQGSVSTVGVVRWADESLGAGRRRPGCTRRHLHPLGCFDIPTRTKSVETGKVPAGGMQVVNSSGHASYSGPCPPSGEHRYRFTVYALDAPTGLAKNAKLDEALDVIGDHATSRGTIAAHLRAT